MYVYNTQNRGNESHTKREEQIRVQRYIESMPIYLPIERLEDPARREGD
jgi:hypothetical protein